MASQEALLKEVRENFDYCVAEWAEIRREGGKDMRYRAGDPWDPRERAAREAAKRQCLQLDEIGQYCNQAVNTVRQNKRAIRVVPEGNGATDDTAEKRAGIIRGIEYKSKAQAAYITAFEGSIDRSYGYVKLSTRYESARSRHQELVILPVPNPDTIYLDPDAKQRDWSDGEYAFEIESFRENKFRSRWKSAKIQSFSMDHQQIAPAWVKDGKIQVAAYWKVTKNKRDLIFFENGEDAFLDEIQGAKLSHRQVRQFGLDVALVTLPDGTPHQVETRPSEDPKVCQYITNGLEIIEENPWAGKWIPIFPCFGKALYVPLSEGGPTKLHLLSLVRLARDPYMLYCYIRTCEAEVAGQVPKNIYLGYEGQFDTSTDWASINSSLTPYAEVKAKTTATGEAILNLPERQNWEPAIQGLEQMAESAKRAIQSAMSMGSTSVGRHDPSVRSGIAIKELNTQAETGNYHFTDALDGMIEHLGRATDDMLGVIYEGDREVGVRDRKDEYSKLRINGPHQDPKTGKVTQFNTNQGDHGVTISTGPSNDSQRDEVNDFASTLVQMPNVPPKAMAIAIKLRNLGPLGDELAECFDPQKDKPDPGQLQQQVQQSGQMIEQLTATVHELQDQIDFKRAELQLKRYAIDEQEKTKRTLGLAQIDQADAIELLKQEIDVLKQRADHAHQAAQSQQDQQHQVALAAASPQPASTGSADTGAPGDGGSPEQV